MAKHYWQLGRHRAAAARLAAGGKRRRRSKVERRRKVIVEFTKMGAVTLWQMVCQPATQLKPEHWYRAEDTTGEVEMARLHKFCEEVLPSKKSEQEVFDREMGKTREIPAREFNDCVHSMRKDIVDRALEVVKHFRKQANDKRGRILPGVFAELEASLKGNAQPTVEPLDDPDDAEELAKRREALKTKQGAETDPQEG
jgi:hypothetical protein